MMSQGEISTRFAKSLQVFNINIFNMRPGELFLYMCCPLTYFLNAVVDFELYWEQHVHFTFTLQRDPCCWWSQMLITQTGDLLRRCVLCKWSCWQMCACELTTLYPNKWLPCLLRLLSRNRISIGIKGYELFNYYGTFCLIWISP